MEEETLKRKLVYKGKILDLYVDTVSLPDKRQATREIIKHSGAVAVIPLIEKDKFLLIKQYR